MKSIHISIFPFTLTCFGANFSSRVHIKEEKQCEGLSRLSKKKKKIDKSASSKLLLTGLDAAEKRTMLHKLKLDLDQAVPVHSQHSYVGQR